MGRRGFSWAPAVTLSAPVIETDRLRLRAHGANDLADALAMRCDPIVTRFIGATSSTEQQAWSRITSYTGHWALCGFGYWAIEEKASGKFIGELGFADFKRDISSDMRDVPEMGWALASEFHGRGYATEAVRAAISWGDEFLASKRTVCMIETANLASIGVATKCGFSEFKQTEFLGEPVLFFERIARGM
jgi:RimJ/RimL family protein N-acetyltransferase